MPTEPKRIKVTPDSELGPRLEEVATTPLLLEKDGVVYRRARAETEAGWAADDPDSGVAAVAQTAGSWADVDADAFVEALCRAREEGSRSADRPDAASA